jgi:diguanylate cyclase (GGDEF)-like protein
VFKYVLWISFLLLVTASAANASAIPLHSLTGQDEPLENFTVWVLQDDDQSLSFNDIRTAETQGSLASSRFSLQSSRANYWFAFRLTNDSGEEVDKVIRLGEVFMHTADLYFEEEGQWQIEENGLKIPIYDRRVRNRAPIFKVTLAPFQTQTYYLKIQSRFHNYIGIVISNYETYASDNAFSVAGYFAFFGASLSLLLYNLFLYISLRDKSYLYYVTYGLLFVSFSSIYGGFSLFVFTTPSAHYLIHGSIALFFVFMALFVRSLLETKKYSPRADKFLIGIATTFFIISLLINFNIDFYTLFLNAAILAAISFWVIGWILFHRGQPLAKFYLAATTLYVIGISISAALALGFLPYTTFSRHAYMAGSLCEMIIFSFALGHRYRLLQVEKFKAEKALTEVEYQQRVRLEQLVEERTRELQQANNKLRLLSMTDGLTGIANRRSFDDTLVREWNRMLRSHSSISLIMCDIDRFKDYNDQLGHQAGDVCLHKIAEAIASSIKRSSDVVARYGGEEFSIILPHTDLATATELCETIQETIAALHIPNPVGEPASYITLSYGISTLMPEQPNGSEELIKRADRALYLSKQNGRNRLSTDQN